MVPFGKIYSYPGNWRVQRAQVVAVVNGLEVPSAVDFAMGQTNRTPEFLSKFPLGKVPAFEGADGFCLTEGAAIANYIAASGPKADQLLGQDVKTRALVAQWTALAETELSSNIMPPAVMCQLKLIPFDEKKYEFHLANLVRALKRLEVALQGGKNYLLGDQLTLADIMVSAPLFYALGFLVDAEIRKEIPETMRYLLALGELPQFKEVFGEVKPVDKRIRP